jgi:hypothetical protein
MPAPKALSALPKPVLFGLYGAIGGLLGALCFGELIMAVLGPKKYEAPPPAKPEPRLAVVASSDLQIYQGGTNKLFVQILRDEFDDEVEIRVDGLPPGISAGKVTIPAKQDQAEVELTAQFSADVGASGNPVVVATAKPGGTEVSAKAPFKVGVLASPMPQADILFVLDVTQSMQNQIDGLKDGITTFASDLYRAKVDARFACLAFRDLDEGEPSKLLDFKGETFTSSAEVFRQEVGRLRASGGGDVPESSLEAITEAANVTDWRKAAVRTLVLITDAPPKLARQGNTKDAAIEALRKNKIDFLHIVANPRDQAVYIDIQKGATGTGDKESPDRGKVFNLGTVARNPDAMTTRLLPEMTRAIVAAAESKRPDTKPELAKRPDAKPELPVVKGVQSSETYDKGDSWLLVLAVGVWTGAIAALVCLSLLGGQHHYLRGTLPPVGGVLAALGGGALVGLVGGAAGQGLFLLANTDSVIVDAIFRVMGWTILGSLAGLGLSLFVPNLKLVYGLGGGAVGGAVGAVGFLMVSGVLRAISLPPSIADILGRLAGGLALGLFIGLMVAVVEAAFRRAWLEVRYGPREMVTVNLGAEPVKVGSDSRACTVWARGAAEVELRYFIRDGKVICNDVPSREEEVVSDGDTRDAGNVTVVVRTGTGAESPSTSRRPAPPPIPKSKAKPAPKKAKHELEEVEDLPEMLELGEEGDRSLPTPATPQLAKPQAASAPTPSAPPLRPPVPLAGRPPVPTTPAAPPRPTSPPPPAAPAAAPAIKPAARDPDACPSCGRKNAGRPGTRYCMVCDQTY